MRVLVTGLVLLTLSAALVRAEESKVAIDPQADKALRAMSDLLAATKAFRLRVAVVEDEMSPKGKLVQVSRESEVLVRRPDALFVRTQGPDKQRTLWYKGKTLTVLDTGRNEYSAVEVPGTIDEMLDFLFEKYDITAPLADLLFQDPYADLVENVQTGTYVGQDAVTGRLCHHLLFTQEKVDWQIWIDAGDKPLPRKVVITYKQEPDCPEYMAYLNDWDLSPTVPETTFDFAAPAGAKAVDMKELSEEKGQ